MQTNTTDIKPVSGSKPPVIDALVSPEGSLEILSQEEVNRLINASSNGQNKIFRHCCLAVLAASSNPKGELNLQEAYPDFNLEVLQQEKGVKLKLTSAPAEAFVDGVMIKGMQENLFALLRDLVYVKNEIQASAIYDLTSSAGITHAVFNILRNAKILIPNLEPNLIVCWGGHSISRAEYEYSKDVGYHLGLRGLNICTGCGPGAMKAPMKGANLAHAKQRTQLKRYIGISEPGIIANEAPNPIVNELVVMPDIEKRLEAFVRLAHGIIVFPGGVGTAEEILYLLGILANPANQNLPLPVIFTGPEESRAYFEQLDDFIVSSLGIEMRQHYEIILANPEKVAQKLKQELAKVTADRIHYHDAFYFNWRLTIDLDFQQPFIPTHQAMAALKLNSSLPAHKLATNLRKAFSGIVAGNVKPEGITAVAKYGPYRLHGEAQLMQNLDKLLTSFAEQGRMKLAGTGYLPCYTLEN